MKGDNRADTIEDLFNSICPTVEDACTMMLCILWNQYSGHYVPQYSA